MTDIDLKRLTVDREYWDEVTPTGSEYYCPSNDTYYMFCPLTGMKWRQCAPGCYSWEDKNPVYQVPPNSIPRPPKRAQEVEWGGEGLPPVGWHGECTWGQKVNWYECVMLPRYCLALYKHGGWSLMDIFPEAGHEFRPLRTDAERELDELAALCDDYIKRDDYGHNLADAILSKYNLEPKP